MADQQSLATTSNELSQVAVCSLMLLDHNRICQSARTFKFSISRNDQDTDSDTVLLIKLASATGVQRASSLQLLLHPLLLSQPTSTPQTHISHCNSTEVQMMVDHQSQTINLKWTVAASHLVSRLLLPMCLTTVDSSSKLSFLTTK